ncbi:HAEPLYID family protein [Lunatibacter salilacus]|uniref:HAEPLYID family protein n=1 Tax=Lunatibacter salilacus TaxID=2483804 RepID=UPI00131EA7BF|nr:HAEPLYID family protein [Lunatibacter salilacus]
MKGISLLIFLLAAPTAVLAQFFPKKPETGLRPQVMHADPVFEDMTTVLGARKGENELNLNFGYNRVRNNHHSLLGQIEYEIAPVDYLGFEIVLPYSLYFSNEMSPVPRPDNQLEFLQWASQYTFYVNEKKGISMGLGFKNVLEMRSPEGQHSGFKLEEMSLLPFYMIGKNWQDTYFFLFSGGPEITRQLRPLETEWAINLNSNFHYAFSEKDHMVGLEINKQIAEGAIGMIFRPQLTLNVWEDIVVGMVIGIPVGLEEDKWNAFVRLAYEFR